MTYVIGISGWSGSGKTRLITKLIKYFVNDHNLRVCTLKHAHSSFRLDKKGKDSYKFMTSGAVQVQVLEGEDAVANYRKIMGATNPAEAEDGTIRKLYAESIEANSVHGSDSEENAKIEINFFFSGSELV